MYASHWSRGMTLMLHWSIDPHKYIYACAHSIQIHNPIVLVVKEA